MTYLMISNDLCHGDLTPSDCTSINIVKGKNGQKRLRPFLVELRTYLMFSTAKNKIELHHCLWSIDSTKTKHYNHNRWSLH